MLQFFLSITYLLIQPLSLTISLLIVNKIKAIKFGVRYCRIAKILFQILDLYYLTKIFILLRLSIKTLFIDTHFVLQFT